MLLLIGEVSQNYSLFYHNWNLHHALKDEAFKLGRQREFLKEMGFCWDFAFSLCHMTWNDDVARIVAEETTAYFNATFILAGSRVARAFNLKPHYLQEQGNFVVIPYPHTSYRVWNDPHIRENAKLLAKKLRDQNS
jgi:hypothetical protein